jgi:hypothetical protein
MLPAKAQMVTKKYKLSLARVFDKIVFLYSSSKSIARRTHAACKGTDDKIKREKTSFKF